MKRLLALAFAATILPLAIALAAEPVSIRTRTAGELAEACGTNPREPAADAKLNFCYGFAQGAIDVELQHAGDKRPFCFPNPAPKRTATMGEFVGWVRSMPDRREMPSTEGLFRFLAERFPCK